MAWIKFYVEGRSFYIRTPIDANPVLPTQAARVVIKWGFNKANVTCWNTAEPIVTDTKQKIYCSGLHLAGYFVGS